MLEHRIKGDETVVKKLIFPISLRLLVETTSRIFTVFFLLHGLLQLPGSQTKYVPSRSVSQKLTSRAESCALCHVCQRTDNVGHRLRRFSFEIEPFYYEELAKRQCEKHGLRR